MPTQLIMSSSSSLNRAFWVDLPELDLSFEVSPNETIVDAAIKHGVEIPTACENGHCGTCVMKVLEGEADHRDRALTEQRQAEGWICACVSRAKSERIRLEVW